VEVSAGLGGLVPPYVLKGGFRIPMGILLGLLAASGVAVFFWPMYTVHRFMVEECNDLQQAMDGIARRVQHLDRSLLSNPSSTSAEKRAEALAEIESLKALYEHTRRAPTWPFERTVALKFVSTQVIPILSLAGLGGPLRGLVEIVGKILTGGGTG
jgi:hypothetical protein